MTILVGIRFRIKRFSGRISWCMARYSVMTKIFSHSSVARAGRESGTLIGMGVASYILYIDICIRVS